jgi:enoyl-CoA hydratase/carnithine racemase
MPEVTIGLFPDAGASWILKDLPPAYGLFLGMTGTHMNAADALHIGLATHAIAADAWPRLVDALAAREWRDDATVEQVLDDLINDCESPQLAASPLRAHGDQLHAAISNLPATRAESVDRLMGLTPRDEWLERGLAVLGTGCPVSIGIVHEQLLRVGQMSLADVFRMELCVATHCARNPDFAEGVRALIIDKDNRPAWCYSALADLPDDYVLGHFEPPWPSHPLAALGEA